MVNNETITMSLSIAVALDEIIQKLMYSVVEKDKYMENSKPFCEKNVSLHSTNT